MPQIIEKTQIISTMGPAGPFHAKSFGSLARSQIWVHQVSAPTVVLGSTQNPDILNNEWVSNGGYDVVKRRSGGGVVIIEPATSVWVDVVIAPDHHLWLDDVGQAFLWVGQAWARALQALGLSDLQVHDGPATDPELGRLLCFGSLGYGEVLAGSSKVVGLSQRRTKHGARFQGIAHRRIDPLDLTEVFATVVANDRPPLTSLKIGAEFDVSALRNEVIAQLDRALTTPR